MFSDGKYFGNLSIQGKQALNNMKNCCYELCGNQTNFALKNRSTAFTGMVNSMK